MGMDVVGRNQSAEAGEYFQANVWSWRPIHSLIVQVCSDLLGEEMIVGMGYNNGAGPADQTTCTAMANRFERWVEHHVSGHSVESDLRITREGALVTEQESNENPDLET